MQGESAGREFSVNGSGFVVARVRGRVREVQRAGKALQMLLAAEDGWEEEIEVPWHAEIEEEDSVYVVFGYPADNPRSKTAYYLYNESKDTLEEKRRLPKPNKGAGLALLDFALVVILGLSMSPVIADIMENKPGRSLIAICAIILLLYLMVHKLTSSLLMKRQIQEVEAVNDYILELSRETDGAGAQP